MRVITGLGNIPPVRRWETGALRAYRRSILPTEVYDRGRLEAPKPFFTPAFRVETAGYGIAPPADAGEPVSALRGFAGFGASTPECEEAIVNLRNSITTRLDRVSPSVKAKALTVLQQTSGAFTDCTWRRTQIQQLHDEVINDLRAQAGLTPKTAEQIDNPRPPGPPGEDNSSFLDNFYKDGKLTPVGIGTIVAGGLLVLAIGTGTAGALLGRRR